ncbi:MAG TPA: TIGR03086 family metal-binding protein [Acidimicrobiales bacterium]|jgi:uncharacterized protein (TIGR03086 family)
MDPREYLALAGQGFRTVLRATDEDSWGRATPCEGWTVWDLIGHVVVGNQRATYLLGGASRERTNALVAGDRLGEDPLGSFDRSLAAQADAFAEPGALERPCEIAIGQVPGRGLLQFRTVDLAVHAWDLARAIGTDETLDPDLVDYLWRDIQPMVSVMGTMGVFGTGPSGTLREDASSQLKLLDASGRRP